jgi:DNA-binding NarL/FixJ family response regulator
MPIRIITADDHPIVRDGLKFAIEKSGADIQIVGEAADGDEVLALARKVPADVFIVDITMPGPNGLEVTHRLRELCPDARVIILSLHESRALVEAAIAAGARGYLVKESATRDLIEAIRAVHRGDVFLSPAVARYLVADLLEHAGPGGGRRHPGLTGRELEVLRLIAEGLTGKDIAARLQVAPATVHVHRRNLMAKLGLHKETELVRYAVHEGLAKP